MKISQDDLLDALRVALQKPADGSGVTVAELMEMTGYGVERVRRALRELQRQGRLEVVQMQRPAIDGRLARLPGYRIKSEGKKARRATART